MSLNYSELSERLDKLLADPSIMDDFFDNQIKAQAHQDRWKEKVRNYVDSLDEVTFSIKIESLIEHDKKVSDLLYSRGIDGQSDLVYLLYESLSDLAEEVEENELSLFSVGCYKYKGYTFDMIQGQGCAVLINKIDKDE